MVSVSLDKLGKKFNREWIFRDLNFKIDAGDKIAILGGNGSGKSTLLQVISGFVMPNEGHVRFFDGTSISPSNEIEQEKTKDLISFASPYIQLIEEFTALELIEHIRPYKPFKIHGAEEILNITELTAAKNKSIKQFSSGMKQRLKLALAILADTPVLLLDEPLSNLDRNAIEWYKKMMEAHSMNRTVLVCSNAITDEYYFCKKQLTVTDYKV